VAVESRDPWPALTGTALLVSIFLLAVTLVSADEEVSKRPEDWEKQLEMLRSVPYLALSEAAVDESDTGVVFYNPELTSDGYNIYCDRWSGESVLMDMDGCTVHRWKSLPDWGKNCYHHVAMLENGDIVVIVENRKLLRFNWSSELIWEKTLAAHHDLVALPDGSFYVIIRHIELHRGLRTWFDAIVRMTEDGEEMHRWSTFEHLGELKKALDTRWFMDTVLDSIQAGRSPEGRTSEEVKKAAKRPRTQKVDYFHLNTVSLLPTTTLGERDPRFRQGNLLICFRNINQVAVLDERTWRVLWAWGESELQWPHHPTMLSNGHILIFDNGVQRGYSRVVELDPITETIVWEYMAERPEDFFTTGGGSAQRLPNGNTLICETNSGRVFEVTKEGEVVWMWLNPATMEDLRESAAGLKNHSKKNRRVTVHRMTRLARERVDRLLKGQWW
jgi:hypothetical protein